MIKFIPLLFIPTLLFAQPRSIHYSAVGNYLVDQDGKKTEITGHPRLVCHLDSHDVSGMFLKARGSIIWLIGDTYIKIDQPVCEIYDK